MSEVGYDATHLNVSSIPVSAPVVLGYDTGTPDIRWTAADWARFSTRRHVHIDQGGPGSPVLTSHVRDVETGAWDAVRAVQDTAGWNVPRRTIYCNQNTLPRVLAAGWHGDLWLAIPSPEPPTEPPVVQDCRVVAVQFSFDGDNDRSIVFDDTWPNTASNGGTFVYPAPGHLTSATGVFLRWDAVPPVNGKPPTGYTVVFYGLDGHEYYHDVVTSTQVMVTGLHTGWTFNVFVWANGGAIAPPHAAIQVHT